MHTLPVLSISKEAGEEEKELHDFVYASHSHGSDRRGSLW